MRNNKIIQNKMANPKSKLNKLKSPISARKNFAFKRHSTIAAGKRVVNFYRGHNINPATIKRPNLGGKENVDAATQRGNIKVVVRVRPPNSKESAEARRNVVSAVDSNMVVFDAEDEGTEFFYHGVKQTGRNMLVKPKKNMKFAFDRVYGPEHENPEIFHETIEPIIDTVLGGFNCSVFAYGSTGAGKTYTMLGSANNPGMTFLTVMELYKRLEQMKDEHETEIAVSYLEVYNEMVRDLLSTSGFLNIREDAKGGVTVPNLTIHKPQDAGQLMDMLSYGNGVRSQHPTDHNAESSRSHAVFQVIVTLRQKFVDLNSTFKTAKLVMVDLAGSERGSATGYRGQRFREGASINRSLLSLANCINALADGKQHIPYRDSKLTRILKDSLGGNCRTVMIANVSPSEMSYDDTYNTLKYANRAKNIKCQVKKNVMSVNACVTQYAQVVEEMSQKIESLSYENQLLKEQLAAVVQEKEEALSFRPLSLPPITEDSLDNKTVNILDLEPYKEMVKDKVQLEVDLNDIYSTIASLDVKAALKKRRVETLTQLASINPVCHKALEKYNVQLKNIIGDRDEGVMTSFRMRKQLEDRTFEMWEFEEKYDELNSVVMPLNDYLNLLKNQRIPKPETPMKCDKNTTMVLDLASRQEYVLQVAMSTLLKTHIMFKQKVGNLPPSVENGTKEAVDELCGYRVTWADNSRYESASFTIPMPTLKRVITFPSSRENSSPTSRREDETTERSAANQTFDCDTTYSVA